MGRKIGNYRRWIYPPTEDAIVITRIVTFLVASPYKPLFATATPASNLASFWVHPRKLTWNLKMKPWKRRFLLKTHHFQVPAVSFRGGINSLNLRESRFFASGCRWAGISAKSSCQKKPTLKTQQISSSLNKKNRASLPNFPYLWRDKRNSVKSLSHQLILYYFGVKNTKSKQLILIHQKFPHHPFLSSPKPVFSTVFVFGTKSKFVTLRTGSMWVCMSGPKIWRLEKPSFPMGEI